MNAKARQRAQVIFRVRSGQMTAKDAAKELKISRQAYYEWENKALQALLSSLEDQPAGRPPKPTDPQKESLQRRVQQLEQQVQEYEQKEKLHQLLKRWEERPKRPPAKKNRK